MKEASPAGHWLFQVANTFLLLSYASKDVLTLRVVLMLATLCFLLWGSIALAALAVDTVIWNSIFCMINLFRVTQLIWERRPIQFDRDEHEEVYTALFGPVGIGRLQFKTLMEQGLMRSLRAGSTFIEAGNEATNLTLVYSGRMAIISAPKDGRPPEKVGAVSSMQFVESPQWSNMQVQRRNTLGRATSSIREKRSHTSGIKTGGTKVDAARSQHHEERKSAITGEEVVEMDIRDHDVRAASTVEVTFKTETDCTFFTWPVERLQDFMIKCPAIAAPLNSVVGADVSTKLFTQAKGGEGSSVALDKRIYLPLDEPQETGVVPFDQENGGAFREVESENTESSSQLERPLLDRRNSLLAEKQWLERRGVEDTQHDYELAAIIRRATSLNKFEISALLSKGRWRQILREGTVLFREGEPVTCLCMVLRGTLSADKGEDDKQCHLHTISPQQMVGSLELLEAEREHVAGETVTALEPCTYISWEVDDLRQLLGPRPRLRAQLTTLIAIDLAAKFRQVEEIV